ncbi:YHS domain-containing (seleno)protein [Aurantivibrio infirmus]
MISKNKFSVFFYLLPLLSVFLISPQAAAVDPIYTPLLSNLAIKGYDTVAYFTENKAVKGDKKIHYEWQGATWLFSSEENRQKFVDAPENFAPQYGGYCAFAVAQNKTASIDPKLFTIVEGKLYLNYSTGVNKKWLANKEGFIVDADKHWPNLVD